MKSIKIKLDYSNQSKKDGLLSIFNDLDSVTKEYLILRKIEFETKSYKSFKEHYQSFRISHPNLNSGVLQSHLRFIDDQIYVHTSLFRKGYKQIPFPKNINSVIPLRNDRFHFYYNLKSLSFDAWLKFLRVYFPLKLCKYHKKCLETFDGLSDSSLLRNKNGDLILRLVFKTKEKQLPYTAGLGMDIGIAKPIVFSDGKMIGSGKYIKHRKLEFGKKRAKSQRLKTFILAKQSRWTNDLNHKLSRKAVDYAISQGASVLALENLKGHHLSNKRFRKYNWAFKDLLTKVSYKAEQAGLKVISVNPAFTSQTCSCCGSESKDNRKTQDWFLCRNCNYQANADVNASKNILNLSIQNGLNMNPTIGKESNLEIQPLVAR